MKNIRIPFNLSEYEKGGYEVITRNGKTARVICKDGGNNDYPIVALVNDCGNEIVYIYSKNGESNIGKEFIFDLFLEETVFEDGDIISFGKNNNNNVSAIGIFKKLAKSSHEDYVVFGPKELSYDEGGWLLDNIRLATEAEKQRLFDALKKDGKRWNADKKCIEDIKHEYNFQPYDKVLVRGYQGDKWRNDFFGYYNEQSIYKYVCTSKRFEQCIPYNEETKDLLGTTNDCPDKYKTWES